MSEEILKKNHERKLIFFNQINKIYLNFFGEKLPDL